MAKVIMVQGTMSNVGKSVLTAGLCRIFREDGYRVAPFKSQNMALNSYITADGLEMGRAQVVQAEACGIAPDVRMNPILLKPTNDVGSQVIVCGKVRGQMNAQAYYQMKHSLKGDILQSFQSLAEEFDIIVVEGAGSPAEINLNQDDIVNMGLAEMIDAPVILVGDIDRGGIFATLYGTLALLSPTERGRVKGTVINKFRGDLEILRSGLEQLEELTACPCLGVVPYLSLALEDEDSLSHQLEGVSSTTERVLDIAVIALPKMSNFTDFNGLSGISGVNVRYIPGARELSPYHSSQKPDVILLPGTKNTLEDMKYLRESGIETAIKKLVALGVPLMGICGGFQMLGQRISDPSCVESGGSISGLGYFPMETVFQEEKICGQVSGEVGELTGFYTGLSGASFTGYEIHMGESVWVSGVDSETEREVSEGFSLLSSGKKDGCVSGAVLGTYVHGIFDQGDFGQRFLTLLLEKKGLTWESLGETHSYEERKEQEFEKLSLALRGALDMEEIYRILDV